MSSLVSINKKKHFLQWFLTANNLEYTEYTWFLQYLTENEDVLEKLHFVNNLLDCPKGIMISKNDDNAQFLFKKGIVRTDDVYTAFHDIQLNPDEIIYLMVDFPNKEHVSLYSSVVERNFHIESTVEQKLEDKLISEQLLEKLLRKETIARLQREINKSLDNNDYDAFRLYSSHLKNILTKEGK